VEIGRSCFGYALPHFYGFPVLFSEWKEKAIKANINTKIINKIRRNII
jgi:hypothetical protein